MASPTLNFTTIRRSLTIAVVVLSALVIGCGKIETITDSPHPTVPASTATRSGLAERAWPESRASYQNVAIDHLPLYLRDPSEDPHGRDLQVRTWSLQDALSTVVAPGCFVGQIVAMPVSTVITPPWRMQQSRSAFPTHEPTHLFEYVEPQVRDYK